MAGPKPTSYEPELQKLSSPTGNSNTSPSPNSGGGTPISFKPNVNRAKTKRWVEARSYSYDGNDWGDEDDDEYDEEPPPPVPQLHKTTGDTTGLPRPSFPAMDRSKSMDQVLTVEPDGSSGRSRSADGKGPEAGDPSSNKPAPLVRPAEIYKRMRDDRTKADPTASPLGQGTTDTERGPAAANLPSATPRDPVPIIKVPEVKRSSGIDTDFMGAPETGNTQNTQTQTQPQNAEEQHRLQHNPSLGFRSAVNQAFDVPETPSSAVDSVVRSDSASTSGISPIMPNRGLDEDKTPTIVEEPGEVTPKDGERNLIFKPGHRRDLSLPSPDNSPSRKPKITDNEQTPPSAIAQLSSTMLPDPSQEQPLQQPKRASVQLPSTTGKDLPAPLRVSSNQTSVLGSSDAPTVVAPSLSADNSPQDTESDRLRKEIIRSLSRENTPSEQGSRPQTRREDSGIPSEYEKYWNEELAQSPQDQPNPSVPEYNSPSTNPQGLSSNDPPAVGPEPAPWQDSQPKLKRRFSWESSSSEELEPVTGTYSQDPPISEQLPPDNDTVPPFSESQDEPRQSVTEKPKLTIIPPSAGDQSSIISGQHLPEVVYPQSMDPAAAPEIAGEHRPPMPTSTALAPIPKDLLGFRDILGIRSSDERVRAFERTRAQFGSFDTGLSHWMQVTLQAHPEHGDIVAQNMRLSAGTSKAVGKSKFPKLPSLGNFGSHSQGTPAGHGHVRRTSAPLGSVMNKQQVEQRGKDLLHTAGNLGGRAGEAAKGFFARGRSKFKGNGEKGSQSMRIPRTGFQFSKIPGLSTLGKHGSSGRSNQRHSVHLGGLPLTRSSMGGGRRSLPGSRQGNTDTRGDPGSTDAEAMDSEVKGESIQRPQSVPPQFLRSPWPEESGKQSNSLQVQASEAQAPSNLSVHRSITRKYGNYSQDVEPQRPPHGRTQSSSEYHEAKETRDQTDRFLDAPPPLHKQASSVSSLGMQDVRQTEDQATVSRISLPTEPNHVHFPSSEEAPRRSGELARMKTNTTKTRVPSPYPSLQPTSESERDSGCDTDIAAEPAPTKQTKGKAPMHRRILQSASAGQKNALGKISDILQTNKEKIQTQLLPRHRNSIIITTTTKSTDKNEKKEMPKPNNIPYHPNDYWDRTRFSEPDQSSSHSIASLPHHPPTLSITSTSPSRNEIPPPSRGRSSQRSYAQELQLRSRSPKTFELRPQDKADTSSREREDGDPVQQLGGFRAVNPRTSRVGDQELPWKLSIPGEDSPRGRSGHGTTTTTTTTTPTTAGATGTTTATPRAEHPQRGQIRAINEGKSPIELHGDKDDEPEEIVMSSTAYPGQEWRPDGLSRWEYW